MPQMAPLNWLTLYFIFILIFILFLVQNYFHQIYKTDEKKKLIKKVKLNWKW